MLGDPVGLVRGFGAGVKDLFYLPSKALVKSPRHFGKAMGAGLESFAKGTMLQPIGAFGKWMGAMEHGAKQALVELDMDRRAAPTHTGGRMLLQGTKELGKGVAMGVAGLVTEPLKA